MIASPAWEENAVEVALEPLTTRDSYANTDGAVSAYEASPEEPKLKEPVAETTAARGDEQPEQDAGAYDEDAMNQGRATSSCSKILPFISFSASLAGAAAV